MMKRPLSSVVALKLLPESGFSAVTVAPLMVAPLSSLTMPPTRTAWAAASPARPAVKQAAMARRTKIGTQLHVHASLRRRRRPHPQYIANRLAAAANPGAYKSQVG